MMPFIETDSTRGVGSVTLGCAVYEMPIIPPSRNTKQADDNWIWSSEGHRNLM